MDVSGPANAVTAMQYAVGVEKIRQNAGKAQGEAAVALIQGAQQPLPPVGANGEGTHINTRG
ncbi:MAG: hypothetical protein QM831_14125 [Kofleriaceae bacterium]